MTGPGSLAWNAVQSDLVAPPVASALAGWPAAAATVLAAPIDPELADTATFCAHYGVELAQSANCVIVAGRRAQATSYAACLALASTRIDVNGVVRRLLGARRASFAPMDDAVRLTGMEYGGITPIGVPADWPLLIDEAVATSPLVVIGSGLRASKLALPGAALAALPNAQVLSLAG
jgi:prolyl-tRNA editing enzyme YbaK/EbsC (Cys-tRNA(Pro) deacylase)